MTRSPLTPTLHLLALLAAIAPAVAGDAPADGVTVEDSATATQAHETPAQRDARMAWWREAKFGLFLHWGVYAVPAGKYKDKDSYGEWLMNHAQIPVAEYQAFAQQFNPVKYDPAAWVRMAKDAGMRYIVITSKHHDGFALFPSAASPWNVAKATPYGKDLLQPLVDAARSEGIKIGFYYSQAQDWNNPGGAKARFDKLGEGWDPAHNGNFDTYLSTVAVPQVRELLTRYQPDVLWWDTAVGMNPERAKPLNDLLALRPGIITNNRLGGGFKGDTATPEQFVPVAGIPGDWETCMTMNGHWGYNAADQYWKSSEDLIRKLADISSKGGNFLLNIGPTALGEFPQPSIDRLRDVGAWLKANGEAIYGTTAGPFPYLSWGCATRKHDRLYLHVFTWPKDGQLRLPLLSGVKSAWLLSAPDAKLVVTRQGNRQVVTVPATAPDAVDSVVVLQLDGEPQVEALPSVGASATASASRKDGEAANALDGTGAKRWLAPNKEKSAWISIDLGKPVEISGIGFDEPDVWPRMSQTYRIEVPNGDAWTTLAEGMTKGHGAVVSFPPLTTRTLRLTMDCAKGGPALAEVQVYSPE